MVWDESGLALKFTRSWWTSSAWSRSPSTWTRSRRGEPTWWTLLRLRGVDGRLLQVALGGHPQHRRSREVGAWPWAVLGLPVVDDVLLPARLLARAGAVELADHSDGFETFFTLTREQPDGWQGFGRRVDRELLDEVGWPVSEDPRAFVCGPTGFVEAVASSLVESGLPSHRIKTERFGPTGG